MQWKSLTHSFLCIILRNRNWSKYHDTFGRIVSSIESLKTILLITTSATIELFAKPEKCYIIWHISFSDKTKSSLALLERIFGRLN